jgi:hypothetical protein
LLLAAALFSFDCVAPHKHRPVQTTSHKTPSNGTRREIVTLVCAMARLPVTSIDRPPSM